LAGLQRFACAEPELLAAERITAAMPNASAERKATACDLLQQTYESWHASAPDRGHDRSAATWRERAAALRAGR
jgi:hypothetical protein